MSERLKQILAELREQLERLYGERLRHLILFGSQARGDAAADSDIDVLVVLRGPEDDGKEIERTGELAADISLKYDTVISLIFMSEHRFQNRNNPLLMNVRREGVSI